ncbi:hypothetical protein ACQ4M4_23685 [Leptolyngbya sp. AN02str]|uniref:hypothetical protein n=1 Tax=Leptolyngbya sp. AN02str TaxID=3423363 RepID=UPI003D324211
MVVHASLIPGAIAELFAQVSHAKVITQADRYGLMTALLHNTLTDEERLSVDRLLRAVGRGSFTLVDDISLMTSPC